MDRINAQDKIEIRNLEIYAYHGVFPEENERGQIFLVNAVLFTDLRKAGREDRLELSTHYGEVCHFIDRWMREHTYKLIEAAAENVVRQLLSAFPLIWEIELEIKKPNAPVGLPFEAVSVKIKRGWHRVYLSVGSNLGDRRAYIQGAIDALRANPQVRMGKISPLLETKPYGGVEQDDFLNGALEIETLLSPDELLEELHRIESAAGRERLVRWGPRTLDLDILFYDKLVYEDEQLIIPHIDLENRRFVLEPLCAIAPNLRHPILQKTVSGLLKELDISEKNGRTDR